MRYSHVHDSYESLPQEEEAAFRDRVFAAASGLSNELLAYCTKAIDRRFPGVDRQSEDPEMVKVALEYDLTRVATCALAAGVFLACGERTFNGLTPPSETPAMVHEVFMGWVERAREQMEESFRESPPHSDTEARMEADRVLRQAGEAYRRGETPP